MADFTKSYRILKGAEFSNKPKKFLHINENENDLTIGGVYEKWNRYNIDWEFVRKILTACENNFERASTMLFNDEEMQVDVISAFRHGYWSKCRLDDVNSQIIANEIFISGTNIGNEQAIKMAQDVVGVTIDGIIGIKTLRALNNFDEHVFSEDYDVKENEYYLAISKDNPKLAINVEGWRNRAALV